MPAVSFKSVAPQTFSQTLYLQPFGTKTFLTALPHQHSFSLSLISAPSSGNIILERCLLLSLRFHEGLLLWEGGGASWLTAKLPPHVPLCFCLSFHLPAGHWNTCNFHYAAARADELTSCEKGLEHTRAHTLTDTHSLLHVYLSYLFCGLCPLSYAVKCRFTYCLSFFFVCLRVRPLTHSLSYTHASTHTHTHRGRTGVCHCFCFLHWFQWSFSSSGEKPGSTESDGRYQSFQRHQDGLFSFITESSPSTALCVCVYAHVRVCEQKGEKNLQLHFSTVRD